MQIVFDANRLTRTIHECLNRAASYPPAGGRVASNARGEGHLSRIADHTPVQAAELVEARMLAQKVAVAGIVTCADRISRLAYAMVHRALASSPVRLMHLRPAPVRR